MAHSTARVNAFPERQADGGGNPDPAGILGLTTDALVVLLAAWTIVGHVGFFAGMSFVQWWRIGTPFALLAAVAYARFAWWDAFPQMRDIRKSKSAMPLVLALAVTIAVFLALCLTRADADDECYIGLAVYSLDFPATRLNSGFTGKYCAHGYALTSFDFLRAAFSDITGIPLLASYYLVWPAILALMAIVFQFRLMKMLGMKHAAIAFVVLLAIMLTWGDVHRTPANFGLVRLYQGKGALVWVAIPAATYYWLRSATAPPRRSMFLLLCAVVAATGFSPTGVPASALMLGLFWLSIFIRKGNAATHMFVLFGLPIITLYPLAIGLAFRFAFPYFFDGVITEQGTSTYTENATMLNLTLGEHMRGWLALACVAALPWILRETPARVYLATFAMLCTALMAVPWTSIFLAHLGYGSFAWRWMWVIPFCMAITLAGDRLADIGMRRAPYALVMAALAGYVLLPQPWVLSAKNATRITTPGYKLAETQRIRLRTYDAIATVEGNRLVSPMTGRRH